MSLDNIISQLQVRDFEIDENGVTNPGGWKQVPTDRTDMMQTNPAPESRLPMMAGGGENHAIQALVNVIRKHADSPRTDALEDLIQVIMMAIEAYTAVVTAGLTAVGYAPATAAQTALTTAFTLARTQLATGLRNTYRTIN